MPSVHTEHAERWLGKECLASVFAAAAGHQVPIRVMNMPGEVYVLNGDLIGRMAYRHYGFEERIRDAMASKTVRRDGVRIGRDGIAVSDVPRSAALRAFTDAQMMAGFTSRSDAINEFTANGKGQTLRIEKVGVTGVAAACNTLWYEGNVPTAGASGAALASGTNCTKATTGAIGPQVNAAGGDTLHLASSQILGTVASMCLLLYDRLWHGAPNMNSNAAQTITHTLPRYATTTSPGNFAFLEVVTALAAQAHTITLTYVDQDGNTAENAAAINGVSSAIAKRLDHAGSLIPLNAGDTGFQDLTQIQLNNAVATGTANLVAAHPLSMIPCPVASAMALYDFLAGPLNPIQILDDACLALMEFYKNATTATTYSGLLVLCSG